MKQPEIRRDESITILRGLEVPVLDSLPLIESAADTTLRRPDDVARRVLCLMAASDLARGAELEQAQTFLRDSRLEEHLSPREKAFVQGGYRNQQECISFSWRCEAAYLLLWALGKIDELPIPSAPNDVADIYAVLPSMDGDTHQWIQDAQLRDKEIVLDESDLIYRMHWATRQAGLTGQTLDQLDAGVVQEWHHAVNWLTTYENLDWDEVTTDT